MLFEIVIVETPQKIDFFALPMFWRVEHHFTFTRKGKKSLMQIRYMKTKNFAY